MSVTEVLNEIGKLERPERSMVVERINQLNEAEADERTDDEKRQELHRRLFANGMLTRLPTREERPPHLRGFKPITVEGKPVSETIIEERG